MLTAEQREARKRGLGGSDMAALCGVGQRRDKDGTLYKGSAEVFAEKLGLTDGATDFGSPAWWGSKLEDDVADWYAGETDRSILLPYNIKPPAGVARIEGTFVHPDKPYLISPDGLASEPGKLIAMKDPEFDRGLEIKAPSSWLAPKRWGRRKTNQVPAEVAVQCQWYMELSEELLGVRLDRWDVAALIIRDPRWYTIERDPQFGADLRVIADRFWEEHVLPKIPPVEEGIAA